MSTISIETPPATEPVSVALAKNHLRITSTAEDELVELYLLAAREDLEEETNLSFIRKGYRQSMDGFPARSFEKQNLAAQSSDYGPLRWWNRLPNYSQMIKLLRSPLTHISRISYLALADGLWHDLLPTPFPWAALTEFDLGDQIADANGNLQEVTAVAHQGDDETDATNSSGGTVPAWNVSLAGTTTDADLTWTNKGVAPAGDFIYDLDARPPRVFPLYGQVWPATQMVGNCVVIHFEAGFGDGTDSVPARARVAIMQIAGGWYQNREVVTSADLKKIPAHFDSLVWSLKVEDYAPTEG